MIGSDSLGGNRKSMKNRSATTPRVGRRPRHRRRRRRAMEGKHAHDRGDGNAIGTAASPIWGTTTLVWRLAACAARMVTHNPSGGPIRDPTGVTATLAGRGKEGHRGVFWC
jgi:hypothetical protein